MRNATCHLTLVCLLLAFRHPLPAPAQETSAAPTPVSGARELRDLPYVTGGGDHQQLDLYLPSGDGTARPLVVWIHGGGWETGSRHSCPLRPLVRSGYAVASIGYRFSQEAIYPAQIQDCKAALRWLRAHSTEYGIDPARVGAVGESAGGHLVTLLGTTGQTRQFDTGENLDQSSAVACVVDYFGPTNFLQWGDGPPLLQLDTDKTALARLLGGRVSEHLEAARSASPLFFVDKNSAPFLILHGGKDPLVPLQQSRVLDEALKQAGVESKFVVIPDAGHGGPAFRETDHLLQVKDFLDRHLHPDGSR